MTKVKVFTDGACSGNPGPMGIGGVIEIGKGQETFSMSSGDGTNNLAEFLAVLEALQRIPDPGDCECTLYTDSSIVSLGITRGPRLAGGGPRVHAGIINEILQVTRRFGKFKVERVPRNKNTQADILAKSGVFSESEQRHAEMDRALARAIRVAC